MIRNMKNEYDLFGSVGKRMPYKTPDGFVENLESSLCEPVSSDEYSGKASFSLRRKVLAVSSIAAAVALFAVAGARLFRVQTDDRFAEVEKAFCELSAEDQEYLLEVYDNDIFINNLNEQ